VSACLRVDSAVGVDSSLMSCQYRGPGGVINPAPTEFDGVSGGGDSGTAGAGGNGGSAGDGGDGQFGASGTAVSSACGGYAGAVVEDFLACPDAP
jgi:hypothetical protein